MQKVKLPVEVDPFRAAKRRLDFEGVLMIHQMPRLVDATLKVNRDADVSLNFGTDSQGLAVLTGKVKVEVELECQRCGEGFNHLLAADFQYSPVCDDEQTEQFPDAYEPLELNENGEIRLHQLLEDELLLAMPLIAMHELVECRVKTEQQVFGDIAAEEEQTQPNPFAVLESLKKLD
jgi:uncharacterized protein